MMRKHPVIFSLFWVITTYSCETRQKPLSYFDQIENHRKETNEFMNSSEESPFASADSSIRLNYFPINEKFKVIAAIQKIENGGQLTLGTSDGQPRVFTKYAFLEFSLDDQPQQLLVLKSQDGEGLFLAFADLTSDNLTYGGGRYINLSFSDQAEKITLDFNMAYNPYCEYSGSYSCPLPPINNYLEIAIEAGEKLYQ